MEVALDVMELWMMVRQNPKVVVEKGEEHQNCLPMVICLQGPVLKSFVE